MKAKLAPRPLAALNPPVSNPAFIALAQSVGQGMANNPAYPTAGPLLTKLTAAVATLVTGEASAGTRVKGAVQSRDQDRLAVKGLLEQLKVLVQQAADADPANGQTIILNAHFAVKKAATRKAQTFTAKRGPTSGEITLVTKAAGPRSSYEWQYSIDQKVWMSAPSTIQAKTTIANLTPGVLYAFRYRTVTKTGEGDWSAVVTFIAS